MMSGISAISNLALSIALVHDWGLIGVALGTMIPTAVVSLGLVLPYAMRVMGVSVRQLLRQIVLPTFLPAIPMAITFYWLRQSFDFTSLITIAAGALTGGLIYLLGYLSIGASKFERETWGNMVTRTIDQAKMYFKLS